jgi:hypothetical protein
MRVMKRIVDGKLYDTGTAKIVAKWRWSSEDGQGDKTLYINKNGAFFVMDEDAPEYDGDWSSLALRRIRVSTSKASSYMLKNWKSSTKISCHCRRRRRRRH